LLAGLKKRIILKGTADQIAAAIIQIEDKIYDKINDYIIGSKILVKSRLNAVD